MTSNASANTNAADQYGGIARFLHWVVAALIVLQFVLAKLGEWAEDDGERLRQLALLANHKSVGMTILALAFLRIGWRLLNPPPKLPANMARWQKTASQISHWSLYAFLFALPITGWLMSSASNYSVSWFGLFTWPDLVEPSKALRATMHDAHELLGEALFVIALIHIAAAFKHQWMDKDGVLARISSWPAIIVFALLIAAGIFVLTDTAGGKADVGIDAETPGQSATTTQPATATQPTPDPETSAQPVITAEDVAAKQPPDTTVAPATAQPVANDWQVDYAQSYIRFTAEQAGANFTGSWQQWRADMRFADDALGDSAFEVKIDVKGVDTEDDERDTTLMDAEWFAAERFPTVIFSSGDITTADDGYRADASLQLKGTRKPIVFTFDVETDGDRRRLTGTARLDRLALGIGTGEWTDTEWVGQFVDVDVLVIATIE